MKIITTLLLFVSFLSAIEDDKIKHISASMAIGQHGKALEFLGDDGGTVVYKASPKALKCLRDKRDERGYWLMQDELDCADNLIK